MDLGRCLNFVFLFFWLVTILPLTIIRTLVSLVKGIIRLVLHYVLLCLCFWRGKNANQRHDGDGHGREGDASATKRYPTLGTITGNFDVISVVGAVNQGDVMAILGGGTAGIDGTDNEGGGGEKRKPYFDIDEDNWEYHINPKCHNIALSSRGHEKVSEMAWALTNINGIVWNPERDGCISVMMGLFDGRECVIWLIPDPANNSARSRCVKDVIIGEPKEGWAMNSGTKMVSLGTVKGIGISSSISSRHGFDDLIISLDTGKFLTALELMRSGRFPPARERNNEESVFVAWLFDLK